MESDKFPFVEEGLLEYLKKVFPDRCPRLNQTDREIWVDVGAAKVIRHLSDIHTQQRENLFGT